MMNVKNVNDKVPEVRISKKLGRTFGALYRFGFLLTTQK